MSAASSSSVCVAGQPVATGGVPYFLRHQLKFTMQHLLASVRALSLAPRAALLHTAAAAPHFNSTAVARAAKVAAAKGIVPDPSKPKIVWKRASRQH